MRFAMILLASIAFAGPPGALIPIKISNDHSLNVPPGFTILQFAQVPGARLMAVAPNGDIFVSQPTSGKITILRPSPNGAAPQTFTYIAGLRQPHGMVFHNIRGTWFFYAAESNQVNCFIYYNGDTASHDREIIITGLPGGSTYDHPLKSLAMDSNNKLYVSIGSSCNVCAEDTAAKPVRAAIYQYDADGTNGRLFAGGLRNAEGLDFVPGTTTLWAAVNNRDDIPYPLKDPSGNYGKVLPAFVDNHPPDLFTTVRDGGNYGWPFCNSTPDSASGFNLMPFEQDYDMNPDSHVDCSKMDRVAKGIQAHSAPLGLSFLQGSAMPAPYRNGAVAALHGSWDRVQKTGYKIVYFPWNADSTPADPIDLVTGWLDAASQTSWGRPVDAVADLQGNLLISDDQAGAIYKLAYTPIAVSTASGFATLSPGALAAVYGTNFPSGAVLTVNGHTAPILYASSTQINFQVPQDLTPGPATLALGTEILGTIQLDAVSPGLYSLSGDGTGVAAATAIRRVIGSNLQGPVPVFACDNGGKNCTAVPIDTGLDAPVYLSLYGTGIRNETNVANISVTIGGISLPVLYAGSQGTYPGLDQINVVLALSLRGKGLVDVIVTVDGKSSNAVQIAIL